MSRARQYFTRSGRLFEGIILLAAVALILMLYGGNLLLGPLNQDEGWYLIAARRFAQGLHPYRDVFFTQGPLMPAVYGWTYPLWSRFGLAGGRMLTAGFGLASVGLSAMLAARLSAADKRRPAALSAALLLGGNIVYSYFTTIPKTYALAGCLFLLGCLALTALNGRDRRSLVAAVLCGVGLAAAAAVRLSLGAALAVIGIMLLVKRRRFGGAWLAFGLSGMAVLVVSHWTAVTTAWPAFRFSLGFHAAREGGRGLQALLLAGGSLSRNLQAYFGVALLALGLGVRRLLDADRPPPPAGSTPQRPCDASRAVAPGVAGALLGACALVFCVHLFSPHPYDDYQTPLLPPLIALLAAALWRVVPDRPAAWGLPARIWVLAAIWVATAAGAVSSPLLQDWFVIGQDRFWLRLKTEPDLMRLRRAGRWVRAHAAPDALLLTQDAYLAIEAQRELPRGLEMGPFCYFPDLDDETAERLHVLNRQRLRDLVLQAGAPVAAVSGYGFALQAPAMTPVDEAERDAWLALLASVYEPVKQVPNFGQHHTLLTLWVRRQQPVSAGQNAVPNDERNDS